jgi:hypothetical protein
MAAMASAEPGRQSVTRCGSRADAPLLPPERPHASFLALLPKYLDLQALEPINGKVFTGLSHPPKWRQTLRAIEYK